MVWHRTFNPSSGEFNSPHPHHFAFVGDIMLGQYEYCIVPGHPRANADNAVYTHILMAEEKLGRYLLPDEVVHHIDEDKTNNHPDNLMVFYTKADHTSFHRNNSDMSSLFLLPCGSWINTTITTRCPICGKHKDTHAKLCLKCYQKQQKSNKPSKEELFTMLQQTKGHFTNVGKHYGVSDNAVRKWCKSYNLPSHSSDYKHETFKVTP